MKFLLFLFFCAFFPFCGIAIGRLCNLLADWMVYDWDAHGDEWDAHGEEW
jgi:hypothetical protein